jgi:disulfide bond formation protein DsbB
MSTTLFNAQPYDEAKARRRRIRIAVVIVVLIAIAAALWFNRYWPEERRVDRFFAQLQAKNYEGAYATWMNDRNWSQHPDQYKRYAFQAFYRDWGPGGEWGPISSYKIVAAQKPRPDSSGVVIGVRVNQRKQLCSVRVELKDKTMGFSPDEMVE